MRIAIDIRSLIEPFPSGISEYTYQLVKNLMILDGEHEYLLFYNSQKRLPLVYQSNFQQFSANLKSWSWPNKLFNTLLFIGSFVKLDQMLGGVDIFFMPNLNFFSLSRHCRLVLTIHDLSFTYPNFYSLKGKLWHHFVRPSRALARADKVVAVSHSTRSDLKYTYNIPEKKIRVIYSGVEAAKYQQINQDKLKRVREKYNLEQPFFLYLGNVEKRKNINGIIRAWQLFRNRGKFKHRLVIAGRLVEKNWPERYPQVNFLNYIPEADKPYLYNLADVFLYPSYYEGFGLPVLDAMAAGCPVITSFSTALPEVTDKTAILVDPYNIKEISEAMHQFATDKQLAEKLSSKAKQLAEKFTWQKTATQMLELFKSLNK